MKQQLCFHAVDDDEADSERGERNNDTMKASKKTIFNIYFISHVVRFAYNVARGFQESEEFSRPLHLLLILYPSFLSTCVYKQFIRNFTTESRRWSGAAT